MWLKVKEQMSLENVGTFLTIIKLIKTKFRPFPMPFLEQVLFFSGASLYSSSRTPILPLKPKKCGTAHTVFSVMFVSPTEGFDV